ncbi:MAG: dipeptide ABC transporter ATP-binding protein [Solirubrobacteraceae bacterium]
MVGTRGEVALDVDGLDVSMLTRSGAAQILSDVSLSVERGEVLAVVGESGCGKSTLALALAGLLPPRKARVTGRISLAGEDIVPLSERQLRSYRGRVVGFIPQDHIGAFNPVLTIERHLTEGPMTHLGLSRRAARLRAAELVEMVRLESPEQILRAYPHQLSGGMRQRVMIAAAMACGPSLIVADEPTTALDVTVQAEILELLEGLCRSQGAGLMLISHDLSVVATVADSVAVLYSGEVVERGATRTVLGTPRHPYSEALLRAIPNPHDPSVRARPLTVIPGRPPDVRSRPQGCWFHPRCSYTDRDDACAELHPQLEPVADGHWVRSFHPRPAAPGVASTREQVDRPYAPPIARAQAAKPLLRVVGVSKAYGRRGRARGDAQTHRVLDDVSIDISPGETFGLIGGSGSGKSTLAQCILQLNRPYHGEILFEEQPLQSLSAAELRRVRRDLQVIFQDARNSLDERMTVRAAVAEALRIHEGRRVNRLAERVDEAFAQVGLPAAVGDRYPRQCSGGELQRACIARALILKPKLLICDEAVSSLDVSTQAQVLNLLRDLQIQEGIAMLFITHDFGPVTAMSDVVGVLRHGQLVECGEASRVLREPSHSYTKELIGAVPTVRPDERGRTPTRDRDTCAD